MFEHREELSLKIGAIVCRAFKVLCPSNSYCLPANTKYCEQSWHTMEPNTKSSTKKTPNKCQPSSACITAFLPSGTFYKTIADSQQNVNSFQLIFVTSIYHIHIQNYATLQLSNCYLEFLNVAPGITLINNASCSTQCFISP